MLTDEATRELLHGAAETIDVPARVVVPPARRTWPALVAVASAVAMVAVGVGVALRPDGTAPPPPGDATSSTTADAAADPYAGDPTFHLGPDQVPSVQGLSVDAAISMLAATGFQVEVQDRPSCWPGRALGTEPALGSLVEPGATVTVLSGDGSRRCLAEQVPDFALLDFLAGTGPAPQFANKVSIYQDFDDASVISGQEAADPASWPLRDVITRVLDTVVYDDGEFHPAAIKVGDDPDDFSCGEPEPLGVTGDGEAFALSPWQVGGIPAFNGCVDLGIYRDDAGAITSVQIDARDWREAALALPPSVLGNSEEFARTRVEAAGYQAEFVDITDCAQVGIVSRMEGAIDFYPGDTLIFGVTARTGACAPSDWSAPSSEPGVDADSVADSFVTFAKGGPQPAWAAEVTLYVAGTTRRTLAAPGDRTEWGFCLSPDAIPIGRDCLSGNVLDIVADRPVTVNEGFAPDQCLFREPDSLNDFKLPTAFLRGRGECGFAVELWTNDDGHISGVNYLYSRERLLPSRCTAADAVQITDDGGEGAGASTLRYWHLTAERPCTLRGYPTVTLYDDNGTALELASVRSGRDAETILVGGDLGPAVVLGISRCDTTPDPGRTASVRIELPGDAGVLSADAVFSYCPDEAQQLLIEPITTWQ